MTENEANITMTEQAQPKAEEPENIEEQEPLAVWFEDKLYSGLLDE